MTGVLENPDPSENSDPAQVYERTWARLCAGPVEVVLADLGSGAARQLLDAGCGTGTVARAAARRGWSVVGLDADADMLRVAATSCHGLAVQWIRSVLPHSGLADGGFDAVVANFVINNVIDPLASVGELVRLVRPGGVVALTAWVSERTTHIAVIEDAFREAGLPEPRRRRAPAVDFERTVEGLTGLAARCGLQPVRSRELTWDWVVSWDDLWLGLVTAMGRPYLELDAAARSRVRERLRTRVEPLRHGPVLHVPTVAAYVLAQRVSPPSPPSPSAASASSISARGMPSR